MREGQHDLSSVTATYSHAHTHARDTILYIVRLNRIFFKMIIIIEILHDENVQKSFFLNVRCPPSTLLVILAWKNFDFFFFIRIMKGLGKIFFIFANGFANALFARGPWFKPHLRRSEICPFFHYLQILEI